MANFNQAYGWGNTLGQAVERFIYLRDQFLPNCMDSIDDIRRECPDNLESFFNLAMAETIEDMSTARDMFIRHDEAMKDVMSDDGYISYPKFKGVI